MRTDSYKTQLSELIIKYLEENKDKGVSVLDILEYVKQNNETTNITTVYRRLDKLIAENKVIKHPAKDGKKANFQYIADDTDCIHHLHMQCETCSKIFHLDCDTSQSFIDHIENEHGIAIDLSKTVLYGQCATCSKKNKIKN